MVQMEVLQSDSIFIIRILIWLDAQSAPFAYLHETGLIVVHKWMRLVGEIWRLLCLALILMDGQAWQCSPSTLLTPQTRDLLWDWPFVGVLRKIGTVWVLSFIITLMMDMELFSETLVYLNCLVELSTSKFYWILSTWNKIHSLRWLCSTSLPVY